MVELQDISAQNGPDASLWLDFREGSAEALGALAEFYYRSLYNYGTKFSTDSEFVRDCIQELFTDLWEKRDSVSQTDFVKSYLFKSLRHKIFKENVKLKRFQQTFLSIRYRLLRSVQKQGLYTQTPGYL